MTHSPSYGYPACEVQHMGIAMPLQELAEGSTRDTGLVGTARPNLDFFLERGERLLHSDEADGTGNAPGLGRPLTQSHHQAGSDPWVEALVSRAHGMRNELYLRSRTGVRASFSASHIHKAESISSLQTEAKLG